jgi:hypothetical protein
VSEDFWWWVQVVAGVLVVLACIGALALMAVALGAR